MAFKAIHKSMVDIRFRKWLEGAETLSQQWRRRFNRYDYDTSTYDGGTGELDDLLPHEKKELEDSMNKAHRNANSMHKKRQGPIRVYHSLVINRADSEPIDRINKLVWTSKQPRSDEEISVSIHHGPWENTILMEGMATVLAYWPQDIYTTTAYGAEKVQTRMPKKIGQDKYNRSTAWDEGLVPANRVKWERVWYNREELMRRMGMKPSYIDEYIEKLQAACDKMGLELKEITGSTDSMPDKRVKQVEKRRELEDQVTRMNDLANDWLFELAEKDSELYDEILKTKSKLRFANSHAGETAMEKHLKEMRPLLKKAWDEHFKNNLFSNIMKDMKFDTASAKTIKMILEIDFIKKEFNKKSAKYEQAYQLIFGKPIEIDMFDLFRKLIENDPNSDDIRPLGDKVLSRMI
jgi:hypothetical protein